MLILDILGITNSVLAFFLSIDTVLYPIIGYCYQIFIYLASARIFTNETFETIANNLYIVIGVAALFIISFSLLQIVINPEGGMKSKYSPNKIIKEVLIAIVLLGFTPTIFNFLYEFQYRVLSSHVLENIILGGDAITSQIIDCDATTYEGNGNYNFVYYDDEIAYDDSLNSDERITAVSQIGNITAVQLFSSFFYGEGEDGGDYYGKNINSEIAITLANITNLRLIWGNVVNFFSDTKSLCSAYEATKIDGNFFRFSKFSDNTAVSFFDDGANKIHYTFLLSSLVAGFVIYVLFNYCIDMAVRSIKLGYYQIIAPIPILAKVMPETEKIFKNWISGVISTFFEVFLRVIILFFGILVVNLVFKLDFNFSAGNIINGGLYNNLGLAHVNNNLLVGNVISPTTLTGDISLYGATPGVALFAKVLLILGVFIFIKKAPSMITDMFGIKGGSFKLGIRDKIKEAAFIGKPMVAGINAGIGAATGAIGAGYSFLKHKGQIPGDHSLKDAMAVGAKSGAAKGKNQFAGQRDNMFNLMTNKQGKDTIWGDFTRDAKSNELDMRKKYKASYEDYKNNAETNAYNERMASPEVAEMLASFLAQKKQEYVDNNYRSQENSYVMSKIEESMKQNQQTLEGVQRMANFINLKEKIRQESIRNNENLSPTQLTARALAQYKNMTDVKTAQAIEESLDSSGAKLRERLSKEFASANNGLKDILGSKFEVSRDKEAAIKSFGAEIQKEVIKALESNDKTYAEAKRYLGAADRAAAQADIVAALKKLQKDGKLANDNEQKPDNGKK